MTRLSHTVREAVDEVIFDQSEQTECVSVVLLCLLTETRDKVTGQVHV